MASSVQDWSLYSIGGAVLLAYIPQLWYEYRIVSASGGWISNVLPRRNLEYLKGKIPDDIWKECYRARSAHLNGLESIPFFAASVLAGHLVGLPRAYLNSLSLQFLGLRTLYMLLYITTRREQLSYLRTLVWFWSGSLPARLLVSAARKLNHEPA